MRRLSTQFARESLDKDEDAALTYGRPGSEPHSQPSNRRVPRHANHGHADGNLPLASDQADP